jgi:hypothetical protein
LDGFILYTLSLIDPNEVHCAVGTLVFRLVCHIVYYAFEFLRSFSVPVPFEFQSLFFVNPSHTLLSSTLPPYPATMRSESPNLQEIHDFLIELAKKAGEMITHATSLDVAGLDSKKNCTVTFSPPSALTSSEPKHPVSNSELSIQPSTS